jgi:beta-glucosidase-like glycosyl hydrolase/CubicO group peptidase (beta-lactamase class C family)
MVRKYKRKISCCTLFAQVYRRFTKVAGLLFLPVFLTSNFYAQNHPNLYKNADLQKMTQWVDSIFDSMSLDEKIGQLFMITTSPGTSYHEQTLKYIHEQKIGGILFSKGTLEEEAKSINRYQQATKTPLFIALDGEWGLSMRLENTPRFPKNMMLGAITDEELIRLYGAEVGRECREMGIHINFAPVLDVNDNPKNPVIGIRSFGEKPKNVYTKGMMYSRGLESQQVIAVAKHFPGHGDTSEDSHKTLPLVDKSKKQIYEVELYPFTRFIEEGFAGLMTGHLLVPALDKISDMPSSLSSVIVTNLLQQELGFNGLAITDALAMKAVSERKGSVCLQAILSGNDILLNPTHVATEFDAVKKAIEKGELRLSVIEEKCLKILRYKYIVGLNKAKPIDTKTLQEKINTQYTNWLVQKLNNEAITLLKNEKDIIPVKQLDKKKIAVLSFSTENKPEFQKKLALYGNFEFFKLDPVELKTKTEAVFRQLKNYDAIICGIHSGKLSDIAELQTLAKEKEIHLCFFTLPYNLSKFRRSIAHAKSVVLAYEDTPEAQSAAAEVIMGGIPAKGKLPVTIDDLFSCGEGLETQKVRLSYQNPLEKNTSPDILNDIELIVKEGIKNEAFPGCQVLVAKDGVVVYNKSFGHFDYAGTHPVTGSDIYDLASVTKTIATLPAIMKLFDKKKISLSDNIGKFVPELKNTDKNGITVRAALFHESRLPAFLPFYQLLIDEDSYKGNLFSSHRDLTFRIQYDSDNYVRTDFDFFSDKVSKTPKPGIEKQVAENFYIKTDFQKEVLTEIANATLRKKSGYLYSDLNFMLLKEVAENISGETLDAFLDAWLYAGLGANYTTFLPLRKIEKTNIAPTENDQFWRNQILIGYPHDEAAAVMGGVSGNAGLFSNANDMAKILQMLLNEGKYGGEEYLSQTTVDLFTKTKSLVSRRGLGFDKPDKKNSDGSSTGKLVPSSVFGHTGYTGTCFWVDPDNQLIYIFLSNRVYPSRTHKQLTILEIRSRIQDLIYEAILE